MTDINECNTSNGDCDHFCVNEIGSFHCYCESGYLLATDGFGCNGQYTIVSFTSFFFLDIDECLNNFDSCDQNCTNTNGSYYCSCIDGYRLNNDTYSCDGKSKNALQKHVPFLQISMSVKKELQVVNTTAITLQVVIVVAV